MIIHEIKRRVPLNATVHPESLTGTLFTTEDGAHQFVITCTSNGQDVAMTGNVTAKFKRCADDVTVPLTGSIVNGAAVVTLNASCYLYNGRFELYIFVTGNDETSCVYACVGRIQKTDGAETVDPSGEITIDVNTLLNAISEATASIPADYSDLLATIAPAFSDSTAYAAGDYVWYSGTLYRFTDDHPAGAWLGTDAERVVLTDRLAALDEKKANVDGYYEDLAAGSAEQLLSSEMIDDATPYLMRRTGGTNDVGNRKYTDAIVGGSMARNQHHRFAKSTDGYAQDYWGSAFSGWTVASDGLSASISGATVQNLPYWLNGSIPAGHLVLVRFRLTASAAHVNRFSMSFGGNIVTAPTTLAAGDNDIAVIQPLGSAYAAIYLYPDGTNNSGVVSDYTLSRMQIIDLTQMLGPTAANALTGTDGVAKFDALMGPMGYAYNAGGVIESVGGLARHVTNGFNQWDEEWENGYYNPTTGEPVPSASHLRSKNANPIPCIGGATYYFSTETVAANLWMAILFYDADDNYLGVRADPYSPSSTNDANYHNPFTAPDNARYMRFFLNTTYGTTYNHDICINFSGSRNGEYEPYGEHAYSLDPSLTLRGIPKADASGKLYYDGDEYAPGGTVTRRYGVITFDGSSDEAWRKAYPYVEGTREFAIYAVNIADMTPGSSGEGLFASWGDVKYVSDATQITNWVIRKGAGGNVIYLHAPTSYGDTMTVETIREYLSEHPLTIVYDLATPTTETATAYTHLMQCDDWGLEWFEAQEGSDLTIPVGHKTRYMANLRDKLQHLPSLAEADGNYMIHQSGRKMTLVSHPAIPTPPTTNGTYKLRATVTSGAVTYSWEADT